MKTQPTNAKTEKTPSCVDPDNNHVVDAILDIFENNNLPPIMTVIGTYLESTNKSAFSKKVGISRATLYDMLNGKKNPTLRIFVNCVHEILLDLGKQERSPSLKAKKTKNSHPPEKIAKNKHLILQAILEVFKRNQIQQMMDVIKAYLKSANKTVFAKDVGISRATIYDMLNGEKNPTLRVFMQCVDVMINKSSTKSY